MHFQKEWEERPGFIPCLSCQQPFCQAIILSKKTIELRTWKTRYRGIMALHAGKSWYGGIKNPRTASDAEMRSIREFAKQHSLPQSIEDYPTGAIVGIARLVRCTTFTEDGWEYMRDQHCSNRDWEPEYVGWQFADVQAISQPIPCRGYLGLFAVELEPIMAQLVQQAEI